MPPLMNQSDSVIGNTKCERVKWTAPRARVFTLRFFYKGIIMGMLFFCYYGGMCSDPIHGRVRVIPLYSIYIILLPLPLV